MEMEVEWFVFIDGGDEDVNNTPASPITADDDRDVVDTAAEEEANDGPSPPPSSKVDVPGFM
jgi:hypothetical protein